MHVALSNHVHLLGVVILTFSVLVFFRSIRIALLRKAAEKVLLRVEVPQARKQKNTDTFAESAVLAGITCADYVLQWASIDPAVIRAVDFASTEHIRNGWDFANYICAHFDSLSESAKEGAIKRLLGYVGEQKAAAILSEQGHIVEFAETANQPIWDLLVDGQMVNVKTVSDIVAIKDIAEQRPEVLFIVPGDAKGEEAENIIKLEGFSYEDAQDSLQEAIAQAKGEQAFDAILHHLPLSTIGFTLYRRIRSVRAGQSIESAIQMGAIEILCNATGVVLGAKTGAAIGSSLGPFGTVVGAIIGSILGRLIADVVAADWKLRPFQDAMQQFEETLSRVGHLAARHLERLSEIAWRPYKHLQQSLRVISTELKQRKRTLRWFLWPDFFTVLLDTSAKQGYSRLREYEQAARNIENTIRKLAAQRQQAKLGIIVINTPGACEAVGCPPDLLAKVKEAHSRVSRERERLRFLRA